MAKHLSQGWIKVHPQFPAAAAVDHDVEACYKLSDDEPRAKFNRTTKRITGADAG
jgi:hypothetical protein